MKKWILKKRSIWFHVIVGYLTVGIWLIIFGIIYFFDKRKNTVNARRKKTNYEEKKTNYEEDIYNQLIIYKNNISNEKSYQKKIPIYEKLLSYIDNIENKNKLNKYIIKISEKEYGRYTSELGSFYVHYDEKLDLLEKFYKEYKTGFEIAKHRAAIYNNFCKYLKGIPKHDIIKKDTTIEKRNLQDMKEITFSKISKNFNKENLIKFVVIDLETTGLHAKNNEIIEISAIKFVDFEPVEYFSTLIKPNKKIPEEISKINSITDEMVLNSPKVSEIIEDFDKFICGYNIVGHNVIFDLKFLFVNGSKIFDQKKIKFYDTYEIAKRAMKDLDSYSLESLCHKFSLYREDSHRSLSDCMATALIFDKCIDKIIE